MELLIITTAITLHMTGSIKESLPIKYYQTLAPNLSVSNREIPEVVLDFS